MTESMFQLEPANIQNILIALVVICAIVYGFIEFRKINARLQEIESRLAKGDHSIHEVMMNASSQELRPNPPKDMKEVVIDETTHEATHEATHQVINEVQESMTDDIISDNNNEETLVDKIINQVDNSISQSTTMGGLFISVTGNNAVEEQSSVEEQLSVEEPLSLNDTDRIVELDDNEEPVQKKNESYMPSDSKIEKVDFQVSNNSQDSNNSQEHVISDPILEVSSDPNYEEYTINDLKGALEEMKLSTSGNKTKLIERIISNKK